MPILAYPSTSITDSTTAGRALLTAANVAAQQAALSVDDLVTLSGVADGSTNLGTFTGSTIADSATVKAALQALETSLETKQATDSELTAIAGLTSAADSVPYFTGSGTAALATFTAAGRALVDDASAAAQCTTLGLGTGDSPQFTAVNVGNASDTTITRLGAGTIGVEGKPTMLYLGHSCVETDQSTTSTSFVDLATAMSVTFTAPAAGTVWVEMCCDTYNSAAGNANIIAVDLDGVDTTAQLVYEPTANYNLSMSRGIAIAVGSGSRTIKMQFRTTGGTANFTRRSIIVYWIQ